MDPQNIAAQKPRTSKWDLVWKKGLCRYNEGPSNEITLGLEKVLDSVACVFIRDGRKIRTGDHVKMERETAAMKPSACDAGSQRSRGRLGGFSQEPHEGAGPHRQAH